MDNGTVLAPARPRVRGTIVASRIAFARQRWGARGAEAALGALSPEDRSRAAGVAFEGDWLDIDALAHVERAILELHGGNRGHALREMGRASAEHSFARVAPLFTGLGPREAVGRLVRLGLQFQDFGTVECGDLPDRRGANRMWLAYRYPESIAPDYCASGAGYLERLLELLGFGAVRVFEAACQSAGARAHVYEVSWLWPTAPAQRRAAAERPAGRPRGKRSRPRPIVLAFACAALALAALPRGAAEEAVAIPPVLEYRCSGDLTADVAFDAPYLLVRPRAAVERLEIEALLGGRAFAASGGKLSPATPVEVSLDELRREGKGAPLDSPPPAVVRLRASVGGRQLGCDCIRR